MDIDETRFAPLGNQDRPGERCAALIFAVDAQNRVLMQLRDDRADVDHAGLWMPFGGGVERGETLLEAAVREFEEEVGLRVAPDEFRPFARAVSDGPARTRLYAFETRLDVTPDAIRLGEGAGFAFLTTRLLRRVPLADSTHEMTLSLAERLDGRTAA